MGEQITPDDVGKEVGVRANLRKGHPKPREIKSQVSQMATGLDEGAAPEPNKAVKLGISEKIRGQD